MHTNDAKRAFKTIELSIEGGVATITLDRPDRLNAFTYEMMEELVAALDRTDADDEVKAVILTGRGRAFCAGADLGEGGSTFDRGSETFEMPRDADGGGTLTLRMYDSAKPLIAAINGPAVGIGITMTLPADIRLVAEGARIGFVFARRGLVPEAASSYFLPRVVGISKAAEWVFTGRIFGAEEALEAGLVRSVHAPDALLPAAREIAAEIAANSSPVAIALARRMLWQMLGADGPTLAHELDSEALHALGTSADVEEGVAAFLEKREARFPLRVSSDLPGFYARWGSERGGFDPGAGPDRETVERLRRIR
jgi:enoyl-CoA hydratase/carnithine racemase